MRTARLLWILFKTAIFTVVAPYTVGLWLPWKIHWTYYHTWTRWWIHAPDFESYVLSPIVLLFGTALYLWSAWDFAVKGFGTPAPIDAPRVLVISGPYRVVRNPMYVAVLSVIASRALVWQSYSVLVYFLVIAACMNLFVLGYEEPHLRKLFGEQYTNYCRRVRRWLPIPRQWAA